MTAIHGFSGSFPDFVRGTTKPVKMNLKDTDVTGYMGYFSMSLKLNCATPDLEIEMPPTATPADGDLISKITDTQSYALPAGTYFYSFRFIDPDGATTVVDMGKIKLHQCINPRIEQTP